MERRVLELVVTRELLPATFPSKGTRLLAAGDVVAEASFNGEVTATFRTTGFGLVSNGNSTEYLWETVKEPLSPTTGVSETLLRVQLTDRRIVSFRMDHFGGYCSAFSIIVAWFKTHSFWQRVVDEVTLYDLTSSQKSESTTWSRKVADGIERGVLDLAVRRVFLEGPFASPGLQLVGHGAVVAEFLFDEHVNVVFRTSGLSVLFEGRWTEHPWHTVAGCLPVVEGSGTTVRLMTNEGRVVTFRANDQGAFDEFFGVVEGWFAMHPFWRRLVREAWR